MSNVDGRAGTSAHRASLALSAIVAVVGSSLYFVVADDQKTAVWNVTTGVLLIAMASNIARFRAGRARPWMLVWAGLALAYSAGLLMAYGSIVGLTFGSPSIVDGMRLSNYVLATGGALFVLARHDRRTGARAALETVIVTITGAMVIWFYVGLPQLEAQEMTTLQTVVAAGYPLGNVLLLAVIASISLRVVQRPGSLVLLTLGLAGNLVADFLFGIQNLQGVYEQGGWLDLGWLICFAGLSMGPAWPDPVQGGIGRLVAVEAGHLSPGRLLLLGVALFLGPLILVDQTMEIGDAADVLVVSGSAVVSVLAIIRLVLHNTDLAKTEAAVRATSEALLVANTELAEAKAERQELLWRVQRAVEEERSRLAANIHDRPIQELTVVGYQLERISMALARGDVDLAEEIVDGAADGLTTQLAELRTIMTKIRPPVLDERGLAGALSDMAQQFMRDHGGVHVDLRGSDVELDTEIETVFYRVAQESLANVGRHAGACAVFIEFDREPDVARLIVSDTGSGFDDSALSSFVPDGRFGLADMRERLSMIDGEMTVESAVGRGTTLRFSVPVLESAESPDAVPELVS